MRGLDPALLAHASPTSRCSTRCSRTCATSRARSTTPRSTTQLRACAQWFDDRAGHRLQPRLLPLDRAAVLPRDRGAAGRGEDGPHQGRRGADRHREAVRHRPGLGARSSTAASCASSASPRSSASTTTWARRRSRTCWPSGSRTTFFEPLWNRNYIDYVQITAAEDLGIGTPRRLLRPVRRAARPDPEPHARSCWRCCAWSRPRRIRGQPAARREGQGAAGDRAADARARSTEMAVRAQYTAGRRSAASRSRATSRRRACRRTRAPRPTPRCGCTSTTGAGPACRSTCAPASAWRARSPRSR